MTGTKWQWSELTKNMYECLKMLWYNIAMMQTNLQLINRMYLTN